MRTMAMLTVLGAFTLVVLLTVLTRRLGIHEVTHRRARADRRAAEGDAFAWAADGVDAGGDCGGDAGGSDGGSCSD